MAIYTKTYTFSNGITADGGQVNTEVDALGASVNSIANAQIASDAAIAISKTALGTYTPWTAWTPTISGDSPIGAGTYTTQTGKYCQIGKVLFFYGQVVWTAHTGGGGLIFNLPATSTASIPLTIGYFENITTGGALQRVCRTSAGNTKAIFTVLQDSAGESTIGLDTAGGMYISGFYEVA